MPRKTPELAFVAGLGFATIFGLSFLFAKAAMEELHPLLLLSLRFSLAATVVTALYALRVFPLNLRGRNIRPLLALAVFQPVAYFVFEVFGLQLIHTSQAGMMVALIPIVVAILSRFVLGERIAPWQGAGILLSVSGVLLIALKDATGVENANVWGFVLLFLAVCSAAIFNILSRLSSVDFSPFECTFIMMWVGALTFSTLAVMTLGPEKFMTGVAVALGRQHIVIALLYLGVLSSVVAFFLVNYTLSRLPATQSAIFANVGTIVAVTAGVIVRQEPFFWYSALGAVMIVLGVYGANRFAVK